MIINQISRRSFLKATGACLALPLLETFANEKTPDPAKKMIFCSVGFGFTKESFFPSKEGSWHTLPEGMKPLTRHKNDLSYITNLTNAGATSAHQGSTNLLTCANVHRTPGKLFHNSISCDVLAGMQLGKKMRYSHLALSGGDRDGHGPGRSLSWNIEGKPITGIMGPLELYAKLFGQDRESSEERVLRLKNKQSILDGIYKDFKGLNKKLAHNDREKLDEYFHSIRDIEHSLSREALWADTPKPRINFKLPVIKDGYTEIKVTYELMALALQTHQSPVISYCQPTKSLLKGLGIYYDPHSISHYTVSKERTAASQLRDRKNTELLALLIDNLKAKKEFDGSSLYDNCTIAWGSNIRTAHMLKNLPMILSGGGMNNVVHGRHLVLPEKDTPLANLWLTLMQKNNIQINKFADSTGPIKELF
ncbi:hypothetical protein LNTAR_06444 [Lentisphaera araneosa HTCC2155]|uniref:DUF1552 domain-containing protein n=1 Tax=Lentisphaera araneosa HTCC2155 TaxID=313628 RepID=A6DNB5_9BACT|nr:DUF1552 domain-containing protein [Lentisphaera araneosa]EDM26863.1 hypothetical protein LNTAR_06444 [Lentisphaera araneosa HTCC2155]